MWPQLMLLTALQEEISEKGKKLAKVAAATAATQRDARQLAQECQAERERLLDDVRALAKQIRLKVGAHSGLQHGCWPCH